MKDLVKEFQLKGTTYNVSADVHESSVEFHVYQGDETDYLFSGYVKYPRP